jgi:hypothetical protein
VKFVTFSGLLGVKLANVQLLSSCVLFVVNCSIFSVVAMSCF